MAWGHQIVCMGAKRVEALHPSDDPKYGLGTRRSALLTGCL